MSVTKLIFSTRKGRELIVGNDDGEDIIVSQFGCSGFYCYLKFCSYHQQLSDTQKETCVVTTKQQNDAKQKTGEHKVIFVSEMQKNNKSFFISKLIIIFAKILPIKI